MLNPAFSCNSIYAPPPPLLLALLFLDRLLMCVYVHVCLHACMQYINTCMYTNTHALYRCKCFTCMYFLQKKIPELFSVGRDPKLVKGSKIDNAQDFCLNKYFLLFSFPLEMEVNLSSFGINMIMLERFF